MKKGDIFVYSIGGVAMLHFATSFIEITTNPINSIGGMCLSAAWIAVIVMALSKF